MKTFTATCNDCEFTGTVHALGAHDCNHETYLRGTGGRCEDFPACGHDDGYGCSTVAEGTSEYWLDFYQSNPDALHGDWDSDHFGY